MGLEVRHTVTAVAGLGEPSVESMAKKGAAKGSPARNPRQIILLSWKISRWLLKQRATTGRLGAPE